MILNYPRLIDKLTIVDGINDEQLFQDLKHVGKDSSRHLGSVGKLIEQLDGETLRRVEVIDRLIDAEKMLVQQLEKGKLALSMYQEARRIAERNKVKVNVRDFLGRLIIYLIFQVHNL